MEHLYVQGNAQYVPFARAQVEKLKKLGLPYVSQMYEVDGGSVSIRITGDHEYIRIDGSRIDIWMLLRLDIEDRTVSSFTPLFSRKSLLYRLPKGDVRKAILYHHGEGQTLPFTYSFTTPDGWSTHEFQQADFTPLLNAVTCFAPYGKEAVLYSYVDTQTFPDKDDYIDGNHDYTSLTHTLRMMSKVTVGAFSQSDTAQRVIVDGSQVPHSTTDSGRVASPPTHLSKNGARFFVEPAPEWSFMGWMGANPTPPSAEATYMLAAPPSTLTATEFLSTQTPTYTWTMNEGPVQAEPDPADPSLPRARTRDEVGQPSQGKNFIFYFRHNPPVIASRRNTSVIVEPAPDILYNAVIPISYSEFYRVDEFSLPWSLRLWRKNTSTGAESPQGARFPLSALPGIQSATADGFLADPSFLAAIENSPIAEGTYSPSTGTWGYDTFGYHKPMRTDNWYFNNSPRITRRVWLTVLPDQQGLFA